MAVELPPDPYLALNVPKDATPGAIKTSYRKLVLKFHPDKVQDETQKLAAADQFHKIHTAYEIIGDEARRARYDAKCKLAELKKEVMEKQGGAGPRVEVRTAGYRMPTESGKASFAARGPERERVNVEERRPYDADYFERPRATSRKDYEYERTKRASPKDDRDRIKVTRPESKENERYRQKEKVKQTTRDTRKEREYKYEIVSESDSDSDERDRRARKQEDDARRPSKDSYYEQANRQREDAQRRIYSDDRTKKMFNDVSDARDYIERSRGATQRQHSDSDRRPSPVRTSTKDKLGYFRRTESGRPDMVRKSLSRPQTARRDTEEPVRRERERPRRLSNDEEETPRRPPGLAQTKSAPEQIQIPDPRRAYSLQTDFDRREKDFQAPSMRRADSMPQQPTTRRAQKPSNLRNTEINEGGLPTPGASPDSPTNSGADKNRYRTQYADDGEYATPDGYRTARDEYRTEVREPATSGSRKITRSPSPIKEERAQDRTRAASARYPGTSPRPPMLQTRTTSYMYTPGAGVQDMSSSRPSLSRAESSRQDPRLYGEIPTTRSPRVTRSKYSPPPEDDRYQRETRPEERYRTGYSGSRRASEQRPAYSRTNSYNTTPVY